MWRLCQKPRDAILVQSVKLQASSAVVLGFGAVESVDSHSRVEPMFLPPSSEQQREGQPVDSPKKTRRTCETTGAIFPHFQLF